MSASSPAPSASVLQAILAWLANLPAYRVLAQQVMAVENECSAWAMNQANRTRGLWKKAPSYAKLMELETLADEASREMIEAVQSYFSSNRNHFTLIGLSWEGEETIDGNGMYDLIAECSPYVDTKSWEEICSKIRDGDLTVEFIRGIIGEGYDGTLVTISEHDEEMDPNPLDGDESDDYLIDGVGFQDPGGNSALRKATIKNPRNQPCPTCRQPNRLTPLDVQAGYQCNECADAQEGGSSGESEHYPLEAEAW